MADIYSDIPLITDSYQQSHSVTGQTGQTGQASQTSQTGQAGQAKVEGQAVANNDSYLTVKVENQRVLIVGKCLFGVAFSVLAIICTAVSATAQPVADCHYSATLQMWLYIYTACLLPTELLCLSYVVYCYRRQRAGAAVEAAIITVAIIGHAAVLVVLILESPDIFNSLSEDPEICHGGPPQGLISGVSFLPYITNMMYLLPATTVITMYYTYYDCKCH